MKSHYVLLQLLVVVVWKGGLWCIGQIFSFSYMGVNRTEMMTAFKYQRMDFDP